MITRDEIFIIGDVHGEYNKLIKLINSLPTSDPTKIFFVGDLIDRGPDSAKVINLIRENKYSAIMGNHESLMIESNGSIYNGSMYGEIYNNWGGHGNGGVMTYESYYSDYKDHANKMIMSDIKYLKSLPKYRIIEVKGFSRKVLITHGSFLDHFEKFMDSKRRHLENMSLKDTSPRAIEDMSNYYSLENLMQVGRVLPKKENSKYFNVFGHTIVNPFTFKDYNEHQNNGVYIDTEIGFAAVDTGAFIDSSSKLSAISFPNLKVYTS